MVKTHVEESLGANPGDAALNPADPVAMGVPATIAPGFLTSSRGRAFRALAHPSYRLLFAAFIVNQIGFWVSHMGMQGLMVELSHNDPIWLGLLFVALFIPAFVFAPLAGVAADRFDRKRIMFATYGAVAVLMAAARGADGDRSDLGAVAARDRARARHELRIRGARELRARRQRRSRRGHGRARCRCSRPPTTSRAWWGPCWRRRSSRAATTSGRSRGSCSRRAWPRR